MIKKADTISCLLFCASSPVSRVLFIMVINLGVPLPIRSSHLLRTAGSAYCSPTVLLRIEFTARTCLHAVGELLPRLSILTTEVQASYHVLPSNATKAQSFRCNSFSNHNRSGYDWELLWRYISVALVRGSPLAGVTRYPYPVEPGLSSRTGFRLMPATIQRTCVKYSTQFTLVSQLIIVVIFLI